MNKRILRWEILGVVFVFLVGALLHFVFEWSGELKIVGAIASVNESVWEHFKQGFWPMVLWAAVEYRTLKVDKGIFLFAKGIAVYILPIITGLAFYAYTAITGTEILLVDISIFAVAIAIGQFTSYKLIVQGTRFKYAGGIGLSMIIVLAIILILFTFYPPHLHIFLDQNTGTYGIP